MTAYSHKSRRNIFTILCFAVFLSSGMQAQTVYNQGNTFIRDSIIKELVRIRYDPKSYSAPHDEFEDRLKKNLWLSENIPDNIAEKLVISKRYFSFSFNRFISDSSTGSAIDTILHNGLESDILLAHYAMKTIGCITKDCKTDYEKVKAIHDWVALNAEYGYKDYFSRDPYHSGLGIFLGDSLVACGGYSNAFHALATAAGLKSYIVMGMGKNEWHGWNIVEVDGKNYHVDVTWNDLGGTKIRYDYFLRSDEFMLKTRTMYRLLGLRSGELPKCPECYNFPLID